MLSRIERISRKEFIEVIEDLIAKRYHFGNIFLLIYAEGYNFFH